MTLRIAEYTELTDTGRQRRHNEDSMWSDPPWFVVADGMGGAQAGEIASRMAIESFSERLPDDGSPEERLAAATRAANEQIHAMSRSDRQREGMGTTVVAAHVGPDGVAVAHVGDSRAYRVRDGQLEPLTRDHSLVRHLLDEGRITEEEMATHPQRSVITRALGPEPRIEVDTRTYPAKSGDVFLLCSDGLNSMIDDEAVRRLVAGSTGLAEAAQRLIDAANAAGGRDNITVVLFRVEEVGAAGSGERAGTADTDTGATAVHAAAVTDTGARPRSPRRAAAGGRPPGRRRGAAPGVVRRVRPVAIVLLIAAPLLAGGWIASRAVYFLGTDEDGLVTVYRGLPYELPAGVDLYEPYYVSGVPAAEVPRARREKLLDHTLRSRADAAGLVTDLELGRLDGAQAGGATR